MVLFENSFKYESKGHVTEQHLHSLIEVVLYMYDVTKIYSQAIRHCVQLRNILICLNQRTENLTWLSFHWHTIFSVSSFIRVKSYFIVLFLTLHSFYFFSYQLFNIVFLYKVD